MLVFTFASHSVFGVYSVPRLCIVKKTIVDDNELVGIPLFTEVEGSTLTFLKNCDFFCHFMNSSHI